MSVTQITQPAVEPVSYEQARDHLNVEHDDDYNVIALCIKAARQLFETATKQILVQRTFDYSFDRFYDKIILPRSPVISVTSITYVTLTASPNTQTLASSVYALETGETPSYIYLGYNQSWPTHRGFKNDITVRFVAGYADDIDSPRDYAQNVPDDIKVAILMIVGELYKNREATTDLVNFRNTLIDSLIEPHVLYRL